MTTGLRERLVTAFARAIEATRPGPSVRRALRQLAFGSQGIRLVAVGKAANAMAEAALSALGSSVEAGVVVVPNGSSTSPGDPRLAVHVAAHPLPDATSVAAAERVLELVRHPHSLSLALVSGGASSLLCAPRGVSLDEKTTILRTLILGGATIAELNTVRRHLSSIKGGGLARASASPRVVTLMVSDVIEGAGHDIGSGPSVADPSTVEDARGVLRRYAPEHAAIPLGETLKPGEARAAQLRSRIVQRPADLARAVAKQLARDGFAVRVERPATRSVDSFVAEYAALAPALAPGTAVVRAAEPTLRIITLGEPGRGGRSGHLAAALAHALPPGVAFLAGASDGVDGTSGAAGASVDREALRSSGSLAHALASFDTAGIHEAAGTAIHAVPTGHNLADIHILARDA